MMIGVKFSLVHCKILCMASRQKVTVPVNEERDLDHLVVEDTGGRDHVPGIESIVSDRDRILVTENMIGGTAKESAAERQKGLIERETMRGRTVANANMIELVRGTEKETGIERAGTMMSVTESGTPEESALRNDQQLVSALKSAPLVKM